MGPGGREGNPAGEGGLAAVGARRPGWADRALRPAPRAHQGAPRQAQGSAVHAVPLPLR